MSEKRFVIPEGMLAAAERAYNDCIFENNRSEETVEAAVRWLAKNPIVPTEEQLDSVMSSSSGPMDIRAYVKLCLVEFQRRMFLEPEPEPEVPEEVMDLVLSPGLTPIDVNYYIVEAYRRGQRSAEVSSKLFHGVSGGAFYTGEEK